MQPTHRDWNNRLKTTELDKWYIDNCVILSYNQTVSAQTMNPSKKMRDNILWELEIQLDHIIPAR